MICGLTLLSFAACPENPFSAMALFFDAKDTDVMPKKNLSLFENLNSIPHSSWV